MAITIAAHPDVAPFPTEISIRAEGLEPGSKVSLRSSLVDGAGITWAAQGWFVADSAGVVDVHQAPSERGTYSGLDPAGLLWSMQPQVPDISTFQTEAVERPHKLGQPLEDPLAPRVVTLSVIVDSEVQAQSELKLVKLADGIDTVEVRDGRLRGLAFRWRDRTKVRGAIMSLTGSGGGIEMGYAPILASLGYDVFSLAYFAYDDLPSAIIRIPLEYFGEGFAWMRKNFGCEKIAVQGASRGGELSVVLASYFPEDVKGAIPIVPMYASSPGWDPHSGLDGPSWTLDGQDIPYPPSADAVSLEEMQEIGRQEPNGFAMTPWYFATMDQAEARSRCAMPIERAGGPLLMISAVEDQMWPCTWGSDMIVDRLRAHGFPHAYRHVALRETGHVTPLPNAITTMTHVLVHSLVPLRLACGGTAQGAARNSRLGWNAMVDHYRTVLGH